MLVTGRSLMGAHNPSFEQRHRQVRSGHQMFLGGSVTLDLPVMFIPLQMQVCSPSIGPDDTARFHDVFNETVQRFSAGIGDPAHTYSPNTVPFFLYGNNYQVLLLHESPPDVGFLGSQKVSSTSTVPCSLSRPGRTIALLSL